MSKITIKICELTRVASIWKRNWSSNPRHYDGLGLRGYPSLNADNTLIAIVLGPATSDGYKDAEMLSSLRMPNAMHISYKSSKHFVWHRIYRRPIPSVSNGEKRVWRKKQSPGNGWMDGRSNEGIVNKTLFDLVFLFYCKFHTLPNATCVENRGFFSASG